MSDKTECIRCEVRDSEGTEPCECMVYKAIETMKALREEVMKSFDIRDRWLVREIAEIREAVNKIAIHVGRDTTLFCSDHLSEIDALKKQLKDKDLFKFFCRKCYTFEKPKEESPCHVVNCISCEAKNS